MQISGNDVWYEGEVDLSGEKIRIANLIVKIQQKNLCTNPEDLSMLKDEHVDK